MLKKEVLIDEIRKLDANVGEHIGYELGLKMVKDYCEKYNEAGAHFVGRRILEEILAQPGCIGMNIYRALNEKGEKTNVLVGIDEANKPIFEITAVSPSGELNKIEGIVADRQEGVSWFDVKKI